MTVNEILEKKLISPSLLTLLFGNNRRNMIRAFVPSSLAQTSYKLCLFYTALIQAHIIGKAISLDTTIEQCGYPSAVVSGIQKSWASGTDLLSKSNVFSFLETCMRTGDNRIVGTDGAGIIDKIKGYYDKYKQGAAKTTDFMKDELFCELLRAMPLYSSTTLDEETLKFVFSDVDGSEFSIKCSPFITFLNEQNDMAIQEYSQHFSVLISVEKGRKTGELVFKIANLHTYVYDQAPQRITRNAAKNENLRLICKTVGIDADWYSVEDCWCDLSFLTLLTSINISSLNRFWQESSNQLHYRPSSTVTEKFMDMFVGSEVLEQVRNLKHVTLGNLSSVFYELYINCGVFKTMRALFLDTKDHNYGEQLFDIFMKELVDKNMISECQAGTIRTECQERIDDKLQRLLEYAPLRTSRYDARSRMIKAEWHAYYVLKATGIHADNLLTDEESLHTIDDYYDMLRNPQTKVEDDLRNVLCMLTEFYGALVKIKPPFDENVYKKHLWEIKDQNQGKDIKALLQDFVSINDQSKQSEAVDKLLGREYICNPDRLRQFVNMLQKSLDDKDEKTESPSETQKKLFISYSHKDKDRIHPITEKLREKNVHLFLDESEFHAGEKWFESAKKFIDSDSCVGVLCFMSHNSAASDAVACELEFATRIKGKLDSTDPRKSTFITAYNLEQDALIDDYLQDIAFKSPGDPGYDENTCDCAMRIRKCISHGQLNWEYDKGINDKVAQIAKDFNQKLSPAKDGELDVDARDYTRWELDVASFYVFLKFGEPVLSVTSAQTIDAHFKRKDLSIAMCVFPMVVSVKETQIKRDNIALAGYEIIRSKGDNERSINYILSSKRLDADDYYCLPHYRNIAENCSWMVEPLLISEKVFSKNVK